MGSAETSQPAVVDEGEKYSDDLERRTDAPVEFKPGFIKVTTRRTVFVLMHSQQRSTSKFSEKIKAKEFVEVKGDWMYKSEQIMRHFDQELKKE